MAGEPKKNHSKARKNTRRASIKLTAIGLQKCQNCGEPILSHQVCRSCGFYEGKKITAKTEVKVVKA